MITNTLVIQELDFPCCINAYDELDEDGLLDALTEFTCPGCARVFRLIREDTDIPQCDGQSAVLRVWREVTE